MPVLQLGSSASRLVIFMPVLQLGSSASRLVILAIWHFRIWGPNMSTLRAKRCYWLNCSIVFQSKIVFSNQKFLIGKFFSLEKNFHWKKIFDWKRQKFAIGKNFLIGKKFLVGKKLYAIWRMACAPGAGLKTYLLCLWCIYEGGGHEASKDQGAEGGGATPTGQQGHLSYRTTGHTGPGSSATRGPRSPDPAP